MKRAYDKMINRNNRKNEQEHMVKIKVPHKILWHKKESIV